ncbi:nuclear export mediator factor NEMF [Hyposmocoma kahamanoa]|uniref:nuclear export mediator factor NEMF n=1 Tax=Hyposmocoma kahamanoa TaxID=1477025 RepID=UPI000E6D7CE4|nr:nuclear export mediator factor NEMF [Hyposmocoma kahamanoa]
MRALRALNAVSHDIDLFDCTLNEFAQTVQIEREAMKKLQNVRKDHEKRLTELEKAQIEDKKAAEMITRNEQLVEQCRMAIQSAIANQMSWDDIKLLVQTAQDNKDPIASCIKQMKLNKNHITLLLTDPYEDSDEELKPMLVDIDLSLTAFANARKYYDQKRNAAKKQQKTLSSSDKALKSAERKTKQTLKEANTISNITKARKTYWFEKFFWFISSDNYLVIAGRDQQQNELLVKRYMRATDIYVHAEVTGASSVIVKNPSGGPIPPKTLAEAGQAAVSYSVAWEAKVLTRAWWVHAHQVSKSAPSGEYLSTGSFMIRGKKNYLVPEQLHFGFSFLFRLEDSCIERHRDERKAIVADDASDVTSVQEDEQEIIVSDDDEQSDKEDTKTDKLDTITEESNTTDNKEQKNHKTESENKDTKEGNRTETEITDQQDDEEGNDDETAKIEEESLSESEDSSSEFFPDTHIKVDHGTGQVTMESKTRTISEMSDRSDDIMPSFPSLPKKGGKKPNKNEKKQEEKKEPLSKRGQKGKMKKIKEKYKDQDEEDRLQRLELLKSAQALNEEKKALKKNAGKGTKSKGNQKMPKIPQPAPLILEAESEEEVEPDQEMEAQGPDADTEMLCQLTGCPLPEDELLFAVPVVAPYSALHNYKYVDSSLNYLLNPCVHAHSVLRHMSSVLCYFDMTVDARGRCAGATGTP